MSLHTYILIKISSSKFHKQDSPKYICLIQCNLQIQQLGYKQKALAKKSIIFNIVQFSVVQNISEVTVKKITIDRLKYTDR